MLGRRNKRDAQPGPPEESPLSQALDGGDMSAVLRALADAELHVPMPDAPPERRPRRVSAETEGLPFYFVENDEGTHAIAYSTAQRLFQAWGRRSTAASASAPLLLAAWPVDVHLVLDMGLPTAFVVPYELVADVAQAVLGVVTEPEDEPTAALEVSSRYAERVPEVRGLWRVLIGTPQRRDHVTSPVNDQLIVLVELDDLPSDRLNDVMNGLAAELHPVSPLPVRLVPAIPGRTSTEQALINLVQGKYEPFWRRSAPGTGAP